MTLLYLKEIQMTTIYNMKEGRLKNKRVKDLKNLIISQFNPMKDLTRLHLV